MMWRPKSILQLVLLGFFTVVAPLCIAIALTVQTLDSLSLESSQLTQRVVNLTRAGRELQADLLDIERRARQYATLGEPNLLELFHREHKQVGERLADMAGLTEQDAQEPLKQLNKTLGELARQIDMSRENNAFGDALLLFDRINRLGRSLQFETEALVDQLQANHLKNAEQVKESLLWLVLALALVTLFSILVFIYWIIKPIRDIERGIRHLGAGDLSQEVRISGPLEMEVLGRQLDWLRIQLSEINRQKQQFLRHISHELKTPLASLREGADLIAEGVAGSLTLQQQEIIGIVQHNSIELQRLIENLLDYNQVPDQELLSEPVDVPALWDDLLGAYHLSISKKALHVVTGGAVQKWTADPRKLKTALDNLLSNAVNYTPDNGSIDINWTDQQGELVIDVANSGEPIPEQEAPRLFEPFFQGSATRRGPIKGSGIGLSVARECVEVQGGSLELVAHQAMPVCFRLRCPAV